MARGFQVSMLTSVDIPATQYIDIKTVIYLHFVDNLSSFLKVFNGNLRFIIPSFRLYTKELDF